MKYFKKIFILLIIISYGCGANTYETRLRQSQSFINNSQYNNAKIEVAKLINEYPEKPEPYYLLGLINYAGKKYGESLVNFDRAERHGLTTSHEFYLYKGMSLYNTGDLAGAEKNLSMSTAARSTGNAQKYLGIVRYKLGDYAGSADAFRESSSIINDAGILQMFGTALFNRGMNEESLEIFMKAYNLEPDNEEITFQTANMLMLNGINDEAITLYSKIPPGSKYLNESIYNRAEAFIRIEDYESAENILKDYVNERPDDYDALYNLASVLIKTGEYISAADILSDLISDEKYRIGASYNLGLVNYKLGKYAESVIYLSKVVDHNPENVHYRYAYGRALSENGDFDKARDQMNAILSIDPGNADAPEWLERNKISE